MEQNENKCEINTHTHIYIYVYIHTHQSGFYGTFNSSDMKSSDGSAGRGGCCNSQCGGDAVNISGSVRAELEC